MFLTLGVLCCIRTWCRSVERDPPAISCIFYRQKPPVPSGYLLTATTAKCYIKGGGTGTGYWSLFLPAPGTAQRPPPLYFSFFFFFFFNPPADGEKAGGYLQHTVFEKKKKLQL